ncbi:hypothetical protein SNR37_001489 [Agarivorans aestuarii]|uniref:ATPase involved in DNA repair n=1 Tax=Agarivorans aestuarii TaxID=1563703 RepID=A0ABU7G9V8_9ALTE|nr:hypothetical protein [Agarivorans aestuarii]MEE1676162.1 hypothetical protein [Agarivorans aestuarii]
MNKDYDISVLSTEAVIEKLAGCSPLQASRVLLDMEISDQRASLEILEQLEDELDAEQSGIGDTLVKPILLSICDGLVSHPKLKLAKKGLTATRLVNELENFSYQQASRSQDDIRLDKVRLDEHSAKQFDNKGEYDRDSLEIKKNLYAYRDKQLDGKRRTYSEIEVNEQGQQRVLYKQGDDYNQSKKSQDKKYSSSSIDVDHQLPLKHIFDEYGSSKALSIDDLAQAANQDGNLRNISAQLNRSKGEMSWSEYADKKRARRRELEAKKAAYKEKGKKLSKTDQAELEAMPSEQTLKNAVAVEKSAKKDVENSLNKSVAKNLTKDWELAGEAASGAAKQVKDEAKEKGIGELIILIVKPIFFELTDIFKQGVLHGFDTDSKLEALGLRFTRASDYIIKNLANVGLDAIKDALKNFVKYLINAIVSMFVGMLKKALQIISEGFSAIFQSVKILFSDASFAQKADAITKLLATTVTTYVAFAFEEAIAPYVEMIPVIGPLLKDATGIIVSGIGSTVVVWLIDQADLFSAKAELRTKRIKEVFEMRIQQIKDNTDVFETASLEKLCKDKLQFRQVSELFSKAIEDNQPVNQHVESIADFMQIDLKMKSADDFFKYLETNQQLEIA